MSEDRLREYLRSNIGDRVHFSRVETAAVELGVPDLAYTIEGTVGWLELKYSGRKKARLRPTQYAWFRRNLMFGGNPLILHCVDGPTGTEFDLIHGSKYDIINKDADLLHWRRAAAVTWKRSIKWRELLEHLKNPDKLRS